MTLLELAQRLDLAGLSLTGSNALVSGIVHGHGTPWVAAFGLVAGEHLRRQRLQVGAVSDRRLLHALWELPHGYLVPRRNLHEVDVASLDGGGHGLVAAQHESFRRVYEPAAVVKVAVVPSGRPSSGLRRAIQIPPIYQRLLVTPSESVSRAVEDLARRHGVGVVVGLDSAPRVLLAPRAPVRGSPAVYRWLVAELAYDGWLQSGDAHCAQLTS